MTRSFARVLAAIVSVALAGCTAQHRPPPALSASEGAVSRLEAPLPPDPAVRRGILDNGLRYFVRANAKPEDRAELRLAVGVGAIEEDDDQLGIAHFVEHMAFNGTANFEKQALVDYLERIGLRFGPDLNAGTSQESTTYMLQVPTDDPEIVATALDILRDWADAISFDGEEIDKERGVVIEEWRLGRGARARVFDRQLPVLYHGSRYALRPTIGKKEVLESAPHDAFRRFYRDWYRPDLMAVVAVGDFDAADVERRIRQKFSGIPARSDARVREDFPVPGHPETLVGAVTDPELTSTSFQVVYKKPPSGERTVGDFRRSLIDQAFERMLGARLDELRQLPDPPFVYAYAGSFDLARTAGAAVLGGTARDGQVERGLRAVLTEARRAAVHGFLPAEFERARIEMARRAERAFEERDKQESSALAGLLVYGEFLGGEPAVAVADLKALTDELLPGIELHEVNARARERLHGEGRVVLLSAPESSGAGLPPESAILAALEETARAEVQPYVDRTRDEPLVAKTPTAGRVVLEQAIPEIGVTIWTLSNGARFVLKPTDFRNDQVLFSAWSPGGHSLVPDADLRSAQFADDVIAEGGLGAFDAVELDKALTGKLAAVSPRIAELDEGLSGGASSKDLETLFQLVWLRFTAPRADPAAFAAWKSRLDALLANQEADPNWWFGKRWSETLYDGHPRRTTLTREDLAKVDLDRALGIYRERFADASDFLFTLVGSFDLETVRPLVERWVAALPGSGRGESWRDVGAALPDGVRSFEVRRGIEPKSSVRLLFHGEAPWNREQRYVLRAMTDVLRIRLRENLREDRGGVYGVSVTGTLSRWPREEYSVAVSFGCDPERVPELLAALRDEIETLRRDGPRAEDLAKVREQHLRDYETSSKRNEFWLGNLEFVMSNDADPRDIATYPELVRGLDATAVRDAAQRYLDAARTVQGVLYPENGG